MEKPTKKAASDRYAIFAKRTTFHGFRELLDSATWWEKGLWIIVIFACVTMLVFHTRVQVSKYLTGQTGTKVGKFTTDKPASFPSIWIQLPQWSFVDVAKLNRFGITSDEMRAAIGYTMPLGYNSSVPVSEAKKSLKEKMQMMNVKEVLQFYTAVALDTYDGAQSTDTVTNKGYGASTCFYLLNTTRAKQMPFTQAWGVYATFNFSAYWKNLKEYSDFMSVNLSDDEIKSRYRPGLFNIDTYQTVGIEPGYTYNLNTECQIYRQLAGCTDEFNINELYFIQPCFLQCVLEANASLNAASCIPYTQSFSTSLELTESFMSGNLSLCHRGVLDVASGQVEEAELPVFRELTQGEIQQRDREVAACQKRCVPRCEQWRTTWSVSSTGIGGQFPDGSLIQIVFPDAQSLVIIEEVQQYEWHDLVSDIGGLLGLWLGASMMSLFQLFHLCFLPNKRQRSSQVSSVKQENVKAVSVGTRPWNVYDVPYD